MADRKRRIKLNDLGEACRRVSPRVSSNPYSTANFERRPPGAAKRKGASFFGDDEIAGSLERMTSCLPGAMRLSSPLNSSAGSAGAARAEARREGALRGADERRATARRNPASVKLASLASMKPTPPPPPVGTDSPRKRRPKSATKLAPLAVRRAAKQGAGRRRDAR